MKSNQLFSRIISAVLLLLLLLNSFFYCLYYNIRIWQREEEVKANISNFRSFQQVTFLKIPSSTIAKEFLTEDEIWYNKNLYDVASRQMTKDTVYLYLIADGEEQALVEKVDDYVSGDEDSAINNNHTFSSIKLLPGIAPLQYVCQQLPGYISQIDKNILACNLFQENTSSPHREIQTPPPRAV